jgi:hypothetical protein
MTTIQSPSVETRYTAGRLPAATLSPVKVRAHRTTVPDFLYFDLCLACPLPKETVLLLDDTVALIVPDTSDTTLIDDSGLLSTRTLYLRLQYYGGH